MVQKGTENILDSGESKSDVIVEAKAEAKEKGNEETVDAINNAGEAISVNHDFYNNTLGWGGWHSVQWNSQDEHARIMIQELNNYINKGGLPKELEKDLRNAVELANIAIKDHETMSLRYVHRILHDLDIAFNDYGGSSKVFGVTYTHGASDNASEIEAYIDEKGGK